jgi:hypothetical protein
MPVGSYPTGLACGGKQSARVASLLVSLDNIPALLGDVGLAASHELQSPKSQKKICPFVQQNEGDLAGTSRTG